MACLFAATYPERTRALVVLGTQASWVQAPDMPWGTPREEYEQRVADLAATGVTDDYIRGWGVGFGPDVPQDWVDDLHRFFQAGASPASLVALERMNMDIDIRGILASIRVPTLILNASHDPVSPIEGARYLAERIPGARLVEYPGTTHPWINREQCAFILDEIEEFVTGARPTLVIDRVLTTVLFTDIVDSTKTTAELGDDGWKVLRAAHDSRARAEFARFRGIEIDHAGDGFLARFDGPARAVRCALAISQAVAGLGLQIRAGVHTGEVELTRDGVQGLAVNIGARVGALAGSSEVWVSSTVKDLVVGSNITFEDAGEHDLKGVPGRWHLFLVKT
jgi:class 3 adenylate cyclase